MLTLPFWVWPTLIIVSSILVKVIVRFGDGLLSCGFTGDIDDVTNSSKSDPQSSNQANSE